MIQIQFFADQINPCLGKRSVTSTDPQWGQKFSFCHLTSSESLPELVKTRFSYIDVVAFIPFQNRGKNGKMKSMIETKPVLEYGLDRTIIPFMLETHSREREGKEGEETELSCKVLVRASFIDG